MDNRIRVLVGFGFLAALVALLIVKSGPMVESPKEAPGRTPGQGFSSSVIGEQPEAERAVPPERTESVPVTVQHGALIAVPSEEARILELWSTSRRQDRTRALEMLAALTDRAAASKILARLLADSPARVREAALSQVAGLDPELAIRGALDLLNHPDERVRRKAIEVIGESGGLEHALPLRELLARESGLRARERVTLVNALEKLGDVVPARELRARRAEVMDDGGEGQRQVAVKEALYDEDLHTCLVATNDPVEFVRLAGIRCVILIGGRPEVDLVLSLAGEDAVRSMEARFRSQGE